MNRLRSRGLDLDYLHRWANKLKVSDLLERAFKESAQVPFQIENLTSAYWSIFLLREYFEIPRSPAVDFEFELLSDSWQIVRENGLLDQRGFIASTIQSFCARI